MKIKFTMAKIKGLEPEPGKAQLDVWDTEMPGLGVRVSSKRKTFFVMRYVNRKKVRSTVGVFPVMNVDDARDEARSLLLDMQKGVNPNVEKQKRKDDSEITLGPVFESMIRDNKDITQTTKDFYELKFNKHLSHWNARQVNEITENMVSSLHDKISINSGKVAANQTLRLLRSILNYSKARYKLPAENPVSILSGLKKWHKEEPRKRIIKEEDMPAWYKAVDEYPTGDHGRDYLMLILFTGLRKNEATSLEWEYVDLKNKTLTVLDTKNHTDHTLPLPAILVKMLQDRRARYGAGERYVFPGSGKKGHLFNSQHFIQEIKRLHGLDYTLHDIRRTFTTIASQLGYNVWMVNALTNHKSQDVTGKHYVHHAIENLRAPIEKVSREILRLASQSSGKVVPISSARKAA